MADVSRKQTTEQRTRLTSHVIWKSSDICMTIILSNVIGCCDKIVALLARFGRFFVFVKETAKNIPCLCIHIFRIQCFSFLAMSSPPTNCTIPRKLSGTFWHFLRVVYLRSHWTYCVRSSWFRLLTYNFVFSFSHFFGGKNRNEMLIMSLKNKEIGTSCKKHLKTTIFSAVMPWADPFIFPFIFLDSGLVVFPCLWCWKVILTF